MTCKVVLMYIINTGTKGIWIGSNKKIASDLGINYSSVGGHLKALKEKGLIIECSVNGLQGWKVSTQVAN